ncbi:hypothetical protein [Actinacidiphila acidipaludis]|uniref:Uncharacterized protein n=1 Tax=Actinacidiphila acidipaludis TaxID=2873382 RepID=A0ABS7Q340_9ACTN|nr:hypothetical protein [Streptomyces acidipaludis]MBY8877144.1 hypothetical protein [Streptomyces acidipaludis]
MLVLSFDTTVLNVALPTMAAHVGATARRCGRPVRRPGARRVRRRRLLHGMDLALAVCGGAALLAAACWPSCCRTPGPATGMPAAAGSTAAPAVMADPSEDGRQ